MTEIQHAHNGEVGVAPAYNETSLELPESLSVEEWASIGKTLGHMYRGNRWWLSDWINYGERTYDGDMFNQYVDICGLKPSTLSTIAWVGREVEPSRRREESSTGLTFSHHREVAPLAPAVGDELLDKAESEGWSQKRLRDEIKEVTEGDNVHFSSDSPEWYTPPHVIQGVLQVLGEIDLDPCADADKSVPAKNHYTQQDDGLSWQWEGSVYMNPPYGKVIFDWVKKLKSEYEAGDVTAAIALVPARTDTEWFAALEDYPRCFIRGRLKFSGHENSAPFPSAVFYLGPDKASFFAAFADLGGIFEMVA